ncbi:ATP-dependent DNA helicase RecG [Persicobacter psychrovividus]|uniref:ATP-dependent DNA helicase RecG n=2 Tax=Persicobacter psychrovividus TaxID=387638 RepID=A0ABN6L4C0_9BACT|nr:ATP-dependent DNA helicase RecG [Persicobacter psychrovividus]
MNFFETKIEFLKGVGPKRAEILKKELNIHTVGELIQHYPYRHEDRSQFHQLDQVQADSPYIQVRGWVREIATFGEKPKQRLVVTFSDTHGTIELVWFKGAKWIEKQLSIGMELLVFGRPQAFGGKINIPHPEIEPLTEEKKPQAVGLQPVYHTTEVMKRRFLDSKAVSKLMKVAVNQSLEHIHEPLPEYFRTHFSLIDKKIALWHIHFPPTAEHLQQAQYRLKLEELFFLQLRLLKLKIARTEKFKGMILKRTSLLNTFYKTHLPFELTGAQKRVVKEIHTDMSSGQQMNRLVQGDVGSGKTIVAFITMLIAVASDTQAALMAPTEILATQHYEGLKAFAQTMGVTIELLTGSTKKSKRTQIHRDLLSGDLKILVGTHALLEDVVQFKRLGLAVVDEQHRFGVAQRAKLWGKNKDIYPHVLVMTATPIPRTLAMTLYGDLDVSVIDELPAGRKPIQTFNLNDAMRLRVNGFIKKEVEKGRQVYIVYPLIEESETMDIKDLHDGYESICRAFPNYHISIVHGRMKPQDKEFEMQRFLRNETQIMVATTVIEVGVNVPNASIMIIENAERFGLAQLHQLRGRVGRGAEQSYCILMTKDKLSKDSKVRMETMVRTNNGFEIADVDLKLRGPGDITGTQQSGILDLLLADIAKDGDLMTKAREAALKILDKDPELKAPHHQSIVQHISSLKKDTTNWGRIS